MKALLLENIHPGAVRVFKEAGFKVEAVPQSPGKKILVQMMENVTVLGIRSKTRVGPEILQRAPNLSAIGAFCIGTEQIDISACSAQGIAVFNAPYSSTRSVVEIALGEMIMLLRGVFESSSRLHRGVWAKASEGFHEIRGKRLGIIGYGNIGSQLSILAESLGMEVLYHDIEEKLSLGNARKVPLKELLRRSDIVTVHVDGRESNRNLIGQREFAAMKKGVIFLNLSRGFVVDVEALARHIRKGRVRGAAVDVFPVEPESSKIPFSSSLQGLQNVILTPHVGGSTEEAQAGIGTFVAERIASYFASGSTVTSVNFPVYQPLGRAYLHRFAHIHENIPGMLARINDVFAQRNVNIAGQHLQTREAVGYAIIDVDGPCNEGIWSPEDLFVASVNSCIMSTFLAFAERAGLGLEKFESEAEGLLEFVDGGFLFTKIVVRPRVLLKSGEDRAKAEEILHKADRNCLVSNSIRTEVLLEPTFG